MKLSKYKVLFISPLNDKTWQIEFTKYTLIFSLLSVAIIIISSTVVIFFSTPIIREYLRISSINNEIIQQKKIIQNIDKSIEEISLMNSYINSIIGTEESHNLNDNNIRYTVVNNLPITKPADGLLSREYDSDSKHFGIDIVNEELTPIFSIADGVVIYSEFSKNLGNILIIDHLNGYISHYYHNYEIFFKKGDKVKNGEIIAQMGNTGMSSGPHLHFEIWKDGAPINPNTFYKDFKLKSDKLDTNENSESTK